VVDDIDVDHI
jgi:hypothetical protein